MNSEAQYSRKQIEIDKIDIEIDKSTILSGFVDRMHDSSEAHILLQHIHNMCDIGVSWYVDVGTAVSYKNHGKYA